MTKITAAARSNPIATIGVAVLTVLITAFIIYTLTNSAVAANTEKRVCVIEPKVSTLEVESAVVQQTLKMMTQQNEMIIRQQIEILRSFSESKEVLGLVDNKLNRVIHGKDK